MVPAGQRASPFGVFTADYGLSWFLESAAIGVLYDISIPATIAFCVTLQWAAIPIFASVRRQDNRPKAELCFNLRDDDRDGRIDRHGRFTLPRTLLRKLRGMGVRGMGVDGLAT